MSFCAWPRGGDLTRVCDTEPLNQLLSTSFTKYGTGPAPAPLARPPILRVSQERLRRAQPGPHPPGGLGAQPPRRRPDLARTFQRNGEHEYMTTTTIITAYGCTSTTEEP